MPFFSALPNYTPSYYIKLNYTLSYYIIELYPILIHCRIIPYLNTLPNYTQS